MKYYVVEKTHRGYIFYKKNKTVEGWCGENFRRYCWRFSKQGAKKICDRYNAGQLNAVNPSTFYYIPAED